MSSRLSHTLCVPTIIVSSNKSLILPAVYVVASFLLRRTTIDDVIGDDAKKAIANLKNGEILVLDNVRSLDCEKSPEGKIVSELSPLFDYFVLDALSVSHRNHASVAGFSSHLPAFAGDVLVGEIEAMETIRESKDVTFILGGSKVSDSFDIIKHWIESGKSKEFVIGGALSILFLYSKGFDVFEILCLFNFCHLLHIILR